MRGRGPRGTKFIVTKLERQGSYVETVARRLRHRIARGRIWPLSGVIGASLSEPHNSESNGGFFIYIYIYYYISAVRIP